MGVELAWPVVLIGLAVAGLAAVVAYAAGRRRGYRMGRPDGTTVSFREVCRAATRAKADRRQDEHLTRDYVDGADGVLAELLAGLEVTGEEMQTAYRAGGSEAVDEDLSEGVPDGE